MDKKYLKLQNGSDVRGVALEGVEGEAVNLTPEITEYIAAAFAEYLSKKCGKEKSELTISVGHDSRLSADMLKNGTLSGVQKAGSKAIDCGLSSTPSMFMSTVLPELNYDGAIMITASHLPFNRNGMKFFTKEVKIALTAIVGIVVLCFSLAPVSPSILLAFLFGALRMGATAMQRQTEVPMQLISIIQGIIVLFVIAGSALQIILRNKIRKKELMK